MVGLSRVGGSGKEAKSDDRYDHNQSHGVLHPCVAVALRPECWIKQRDQRSPLVGCSSQNFLASSALADPATPARTDRAMRADTMVFMATTPGDPDNTLLPAIDEQDDGSLAKAALSRARQFSK
jgi:hypothetical protein